MNARERERESEIYIYILFIILFYFIFCWSVSCKKSIILKKLKRHNDIDNE
jgi:hypothetical protein